MAIGKPRPATLFGTGTLAELAERIGDSALAVEADVGVEEQARAFVQSGQSVLPSRERGIAILRDELPEDRLMSAMAVLSGTAGFGGGSGLVVVRLLMCGDLGFHRAVWTTTGVTAVFSENGDAPITKGLRIGSPR